MKKIIVLTTATALLSSCGIYTKYQPAETTPDNLYGEEVAVDDTTNFGNVNWRELFTDPQLQALIEQGLHSLQWPHFCTYHEQDGHVVQEFHFFLNYSLN